MSLVVSWSKPDFTDTDEGDKMWRLITVGWGIGMKENLDMVLRLILEPSNAIVYSTKYDDTQW